MSRRFLVLSLLACFVGGCQTQFIPNTDVYDSEFNRRVIEFCESYRGAVEKKKVGALLALADPDYYEDGGNIDATDDIDYAGLRDFLETRFRDTTTIRYEIRYRSVSQEKDGHINVDFTYSASYRIPTTNGETWRRRVDDNRLVLVAHEDSFRILAGM